VALSPKTARTLNKKKKKTSCAAVWTELYRMFACVRRRRQLIAANEKFGFQPLLERVDRYCWCNRDWQAVPHPSCGNRESPVTNGGKTSRRNDKGIGSCWSQSSPCVKSWNRLKFVGDVWWCQTMDIFLYEVGRWGWPQGTGGCIPPIYINCHPRGYETEVFTRWSEQYHIL